MLHDRFGCTLQLGGSDQWGNITAGMDLVRRVRGAKVHGLVLPLLMTASGTKFGKTEAGSVWLDAHSRGPTSSISSGSIPTIVTSVQHLKFFTFSTRIAIAELEGATAQEPERRDAQRELAREVTGSCTVTRPCGDAEAAAEELFSGDVSNLSMDRAP